MTPAVGNERLELEKKRNAASFGKRLAGSAWLYLFLAPALIYILIFRYIPIYGAQIAFRNYNPGRAILESPWIGWQHFSTFIGSFQFPRLMRNTILLSLGDVIFTFPLPIFFAIGLHYQRSRLVKRSVQMIAYAPYFISTIVLAGILLVFLSPRTGPVNIFLQHLGHRAIFFFGDPVYFRPIYIASSVWQFTGYNAIIYLAVLAGVSPELHESAMIDGATKLKRIFYVDLPHLAPTMAVLLVLRLGRTLQLGFEKAYALQTPLNLAASEIIETYVYKLGLEQAQFSYAAAIGLFLNVINLMILLVANAVTKRLTTYGLF